MTITIDKLVSIERKMQGRISELQGEIDQIEEERKAVRSAILDYMKEQNVDSVATKEGTVSRTIKERYWTNDWSAFNAYVLEHGAIDLFEKRIHQTNMKEWVKEHAEDYPPGLNLDREYAITIRKPRKKAGDDTNE